MREELRDKRVLGVRLDRQWCQCEGHRKRRVITERPRPNRACERGMGIIDPDGAVHQPGQFGVV